MNVIACQRKSRTLMCSRRGRCCCWLLVALVLLLVLYLLAVVGRQHAALDPSLNPFANPWLAKALSGGNNEPPGAGGNEQHVGQPEAAHVQQIELPARDAPAMLDAPPAAAQPVVMNPAVKKLDTMWMWLMIVNCTYDLHSDIIEGFSVFFIVTDFNLIIAILSVISLITDFLYRHVQFWFLIQYYCY